MGRSPATRLVLTLHPPQDGYTLGVEEREGAYTEIVKFSYKAGLPKKNIFFKIHGCNGLSVSN